MEQKNSHMKNNSYKIVDALVAWRWWEKVQ